MISVGNSTRTSMQVLKLCAFNAMMTQQNPISITDHNFWKFLPRFLFDLNWLEVSVQKSVGGATLGNEHHFLPIQATAAKTPGQWITWILPFLIFPLFLTFVCHQSTPIHQPPETTGAARKFSFHSSSVLKKHFSWEFFAFQEFILQIVLLI